MSKDARHNDAAKIRAAACSITSEADYDRFVEMAGEAQCVLIGEASHGTHEFYETRAALTKRFEARLPDQVDAVIHLDETSALEPLERSSEWAQGELPETYPSAL